MQNFQGSNENREPETKEEMQMVRWARVPVGSQADRKAILGIAG